mmetsp:Transcript_38575/g.96601  ORF Transcript_38575/g.96601 Transcript_38575/m.96601 type:complete len:157 (-) Transcript_38575:553-1023(-)
MGHRAGSIHPSVQPPTHHTASSQAFGNQAGSPCVRQGRAGAEQSRVHSPHSPTTGACIYVCGEGSSQHWTRNDRHVTDPSVRSFTRIPYHPPAPPACICLHADLTSQKDLASHRPLLNDAATRTQRRHLFYQIAFLTSARPPREAAIETPKPLDIT